VRLVKSIEPPAGRVAAVPDTDEDDFLAEMRGGVRD
jgi:hypothetical protein